MPSTHLALLYHLVFSTKNRSAMTAPAWRTRFHAFLDGVVKQLDGTPEAVGGMAGHVDLLIGLGHASTCRRDAESQIGLLPLGP